jgi:hypothetical protein
LALPRPEALEKLWEREYQRAIDAIIMLDLLVKAGRVTKYAKGKIDSQKEIDTAWNALFENLDGRVVFHGGD